VLSVGRRREKEESMSDPNDSTLVTGTIDGDGVSLSSPFLEFCAKVRNNDPSILPELGKPFNIRRSMHEKEYMELADALLENTSVTYLQLDIASYTKSFAEAMAKYICTSKSLHHIHWPKYMRTREEILCCFLPAFQESSSLKELDMELPSIDGSSNLALENILTHTQSLRSLTLTFPVGLLVEGIALAAAQSGLKKNTTLRELTLEFLRGATTLSPILTSLREHPLLQSLCLRGNLTGLNGLETLLLSDKSKITELDICKTYGGQPMRGLMHILQALGRLPSKLTKLRLHNCHLGLDEARLLRMALCNLPNLQSLLLTGGTLGSGELAELAPALYHNTSIKVLDISGNDLNSVESADLLRGILRSNKSITALDLSWNPFGQTTGAVDYIVEGLGSNSSLMKINLSHCDMGDGGVSTLARNLGSRNSTLQKITLEFNSITSTGVGVLLEAMEHNSHITDLELKGNDRIGNEGASLLARALGNNAVPSLTRLSLSDCRIGNDGFSALMSALEEKTSLLHLELRYNYDLSEGAFLALAESLPNIKVLQGVDFDWCPGLASAMPLLLEGLRKNTSLFRIHVANCAPSSVPPSIEGTAKCAGGWMLEMERLGCRNRFRSLIRAPTERLPPLGVWPRALSRVASLPDAIFEVLRSKPSLVPSEDIE
jgi:Ran GTPase-activating protein (RanGAP) involved in mRNA processing and transport